VVVDGFSDPLVEIAAGDDDGIASGLLLFVEGIVDGAFNGTAAETTRSLLLTV
jgi:hypothetical protein